MKRKNLPQPPRQNSPAGYGEQGTNKTIPQPIPDAKPSDELLNTKSKFVEKSPYTRG